MDENPLEYLTAIIRYRAFIKAENAGDWMPHTYRTAAAHAEKTLETQGNPDGYRICHRKLRMKNKDTGHALQSPPRAPDAPRAARHN
jgi:hypothetical protein